MINKMYSKKIICFFILIQPLIDVLTNFFNSNFNFSIGIILRGLFFAYMLVYLTFFNKKNRKINLIFEGIIGVFVLLYFFINCSTISIFIYKINFLLKFLYLPISILFFYNIKIKNLSEILVFNGFFIALLMLVAQIFGGVMLSYESAKLGNSGWFFSPNELSSICSIILPLIYTLYIKNKNRFALITFILLSISMLIIGTKTAYLSIVITLISILLYYLYMCLIKKEKDSKKLTIVMVSLLIFIIITPFTYVYKNVTIHDKNESLSEIVLNGRDEIFNRNINNKLIFSTLTGFKLDDKINLEFERDYYNIYYNYGVFGIIVFSMIPIYLLLLNIRKFKFDLMKYSYFVSIILTLAIAYISGHTLLFPSVALYIAIIFSNLIDEEKEQKNKKSVIFISSVGGHLTQMLELKKIFNNYNYVLITEKTDVTKCMKNKYNMNFLLYGSRKYLFKYIFVCVINIIKSIYFFFKYTPEVIVTTGTHTAVPMCYIGWLFGKKVIYIESFAKSSSPTLTGRLVYPIANIFVVQWESMLKYYPKAECWGSIY